MSNNNSHASSRGRWTSGGGRPSPQQQQRQARLDNARQLSKLSTFDEEDADEAEVQLSSFSYRQDILQQQSGGDGGERVSGVVVGGTGGVGARGRGRLALPRLVIPGGGPRSVADKILDMLVRFDSWIFFFC